MLELGIWSFLICCPQQNLLPRSARNSARRGAIARATDLPALIDADTGFGEALNMARTIQTLEDAGLCGCHLEDQVNPKRCGHLDGKSLVTTQAMVEKIRA